MSRRTLLLLRWGVFVLACAFLYVRLSRWEDEWDPQALLIVLRSELQECQPSLLPGVEALIPEEYRDQSTP